MNVRFKTTNTISALSLLLICMTLGACASTKPGSGGVVKEGQAKLEITGGIIDDNARPEKNLALLNNERVTVYPLDGAVQNPLSVERYRSVVENTTAGGYTVLDESVTVYPLPGEPLPAALAPHAVPPFGSSAQSPRVGEPVSLMAGASSLPPVPTVNVGAADPYATPPVGGMVRNAPMLTQDAYDTPTPTSVPTSAHASPMLTAPDVQTSPRAPQQLATPASPAASKSLTGFEYATPAPERAHEQTLAPGRKSSPSLTGY